MSTPTIDGDHGQFFTASDGTKYARDSEGRWSELGYTRGMTTDHAGELISAYAQLIGIDLAPRQERIAAAVLGGKELDPQVGRGRP
jgi:hypothetical protein